MNRDHALLPVFAAAFAVACLSLMDAFMKSAALAVGALTAAWLRSVIARPRPEVLKLHLQRSIIATFMALTFFYAITKLPLAEAIAISFVAPLIALYLARVMLGEAIRREAIYASILGFIGTLIIIGGKIGQADFDADTALGLTSILASALLYAYSFILIRRQSQVAGPAEIATFHSGVSVIILGLAAPFLFEMPNLKILGDLAAAAFLTVAGAMGLAWAYARAEAQVLVPLEYSGFLWASLFGWLFFAEPLTMPTTIGTAIIITSCWVATRKRRVAIAPEVP